MGDTLPDEGVTYRQEFRRCGKLSCQSCATGPGHGPYWYAYWHDNGGARRRYIGRSLPAGVSGDPSHAAGERKAAPPPDGPASGDRTTLVGRRAEQEALRLAVDLLSKGERSLLFLAGDAGVGKTALLRWAAAYARRAGVLVLGGACDGLRDATPFAPWMEILSAAAAAQAIELSRLPRLFGGSARLDAGFQLLATTATALLAAARRRAVLLLLEDIHWADRDSLELLRYVARTAVDMPVGLLVTYRPEDVDQSRGLSDYLPVLLREAPWTRLAITPLDPPSVALLLQARFGDLGDGQEEVAAQLYARTGGNPFFLGEFLHLLEEQGRLSPAGRPPAGRPRAAEALAAIATIPPLVRQVVASRLRHLPEGALEFLQVAAVTGQEFPLRVVEQTLGWEEARLLPVIDAALDARLLVEVSGVEECYAFVHALLRDVIYDGLLARRRKRWHLQVAAALEADPPALSAGRAEALVRHYLAGEAWDRALSWAVRAGDAARDGHASHAAIAHYEQALHLLDEHPMLAEPALAARLHEALGALYLVVGQHAAADRQFALLRQLADATGETVTKARACYWSSVARIRQYRQEDAMRLAAEALALANAAAIPALQARCEWAVGHLQLYQEQLAPARRHLERAAELARAPDSADVLSQALQHLSLLENWSASWQRALALAREARDAAHIGQEALSLPGVYWRLGLAHGGLGQYREAFAAADEGLRLTEASGEQHTRVRLLNTKGWLYGELGLAAIASTWNAQALEDTRRELPEDGEALCHALLNLSADCLALGQSDDAAVHLAEVEQLLAHAAGHIHCAQRVRTRAALAAAALALARGQAAQALEATGRAAELATTLAASKHLARARLLQARAWLQAGNVEEAERALYQGLRLADQIGNPPLRWQGSTVLGQVRERQHRWRDANTAYVAALALLEQCAATLADETLRDGLLRSPDAETVQAGLTGTAARRSVARPTYPAGLSEREVEVLRLIVAGRSNTAIAAELVVSVKTVNSHVASILSKTGAPNRAAAAAFALHKGLANPPNLPGLPSCPGKGAHAGPWTSPPLANDPAPRG